MNNEFYIGWMPKAPDSFAKTSRNTILVILVIVMAIGLLTAMCQKQFSKGNFEFGRLTVVKGIYFNAPVACIKVVSGKDMLGRFSYITIPLIGFGKHGAAGVIEATENNKHISLNEQEIALKGTLLYNEGKLLLQVDSNDNPVTVINKRADSTLLPVARQLGMKTIRGEIVDPKCYFGVMKPGQGKPHKDCAIRCILGGIPPVLRVMNTNGETNFYLLLGANGEKINAAVKDFVAAPISLNARAVAYDDWIILYVTNNSITRVAGAAMVKPNAMIIACAMK